MHTIDMTFIYTTSGRLLLGNYHSKRIHRFVGYLRTIAHKPLFPTGSDKTMKLSLVDPKTTNSSSSLAKHYVNGVASYFLFSCNVSVIFLFHYS